MTQNIYFAKKRKSSFKKCSPVGYLCMVFFFRIGLGIAKKLVSDGAKVMISSRKASNVEEALKSFPEKEISGLK